MQRFTTAGREAVRAHNLYAALTLALSIPDICGSLISPGPGRSRARYLDWSRTWVEPKFTSSIGYPPRRHVFLTAEDLYQLRCSVVHSGQDEIDAAQRASLHRAAFFDASCTSHLNSIDGVLQLRTPDFCETVFTAADEWDAAIVNDAAIQTAKSKLLTIYQAGTQFGGVTIG